MFRNLESDQCGCTKVSARPFKPARDTERLPVSRELE